jgi:hypothetical protein
MVKKLIMMAFVLLAIGMAVPSTREQIGDSVTPIKDAIGYKLVPRRLEAMADQLDVRLGRAEGLPDNFEAWLRRDYSGTQEDPWGRSYYLITGRRDYTVGTVGADGVQGTDDDYVVTRSLEGSRPR